MTQSAMQFLDRMQRDAIFYLEVGKAENKKKRWELIKNAGFEFTDEELKSARKLFSEKDASSLQVVHTGYQGDAEMGDIPRSVMSHGCGTCE